MDQGTAGPAGDSLFDRVSRGEAAVDPNEATSASGGVEIQVSRAADDTALNAAQTKLSDVPATFRRLDEELNAKIQAKLTRTSNELASTFRQQVSTLKDHVEDLIHTQSLRAAKPEGPSEQRARIIDLETRSIHSVHSQPRARVGKPPKQQRDVPSTEVPHEVRDT